MRITLSPRFTFIRQAVKINASMRLLSAFRLPLKAMMRQRNRFLLKPRNYHAFATSLLIIGLILLVYGVDRLVYSAAVLSRSLGFAPWLIGCTIVAFGTSLPELLVSVTAALNNQIDMAVGNILGSNIINIMLIVGGAALIRPVTFRSDIVRRELPLLLLITLLCGLLLADHSLGRLDGVLLLAAAAGYLLIIVTISRLALREGSDTLTREQLAELPQDSNNTVAVLWLVLAFIILCPFRRRW